MKQFKLPLAEKQEVWFDHCRCWDDSGSCDYCQALYFGEINIDGTPTEYGKSLVVI